MSAKKKESIDIEHCPYTGRRFVVTEFPKMCSCCQKEFHDREGYWELTEPLVHGNYSKGTKNLIFEYRNCKDCSSTLVTKFVDERDTSEMGMRKRDQWKKQFQFLVSNGISEDRAKDILAKKSKF